MKTKITFLFILLAVVLVSFSAVTKTPEKKEAVIKSHTKASGGLAIEDSNQWN